MTKKCNCCGRILPLEAFARTSKNKDGRRGKCKECTKLVQKAWYSRNREEENASRRAKYNSTIEHERYEARKEQILTQKKEWRKNNKELQTLASERRRSREAQLPATLTKSEWEEIKTSFNFTCAYCGAQVKLERDHIIPLTKGGAFSKGNIVPACKSCNSSKGNRDLLSWYRTRKFYSKEREEKVLQILN